MKTADRAGAMTSRTSHVVEAACKTRRRQDVLQWRTRRCFLQRRDNIAVREQNVGGVACIDKGRRFADRAHGQKAIRHDNGAAVEISKMRGHKQPLPEISSQLFVGLDALDIDLVFQRRFLEALLRAIAKHLQQVIRPALDIVGVRRRARDLNVDLDPVDGIRHDPFEYAAAGHERRGGIGRKRIA